MNSFNVEAGVFLHHLRLFNDIENAQIGKKTLAILMDIVTYIEKVVANKDHTDAQNETDLSFLHDLDRRQFELRQNIICRICSVSRAFLVKFNMFCDSINFRSKVFL